MMRTPAKNAISLARNATNIGKTPPRQEKSTRHGFLRASSFDQMSSILYNRSMSPRLRPNPSEGKENVASDCLRALAKTTKLVDDTNNNDTLVNQAEPSIDFCDVFFGWLKKTEREIDTAAFARLKGDLCQLVGKYTLELLEKRN